jgi:hypothetical protein
MIKPSELDLSSLPWLPLNAVLAFPRQPAVYFAIDSQHRVQYIGRSVDPKTRWSKHHCYKQLNSIGGICIAYLFIESSELLPEVEQALIQWFRPPLNIAGLNQRQLSVSSQPMQVERTERRDYPKLGDRIRRQRERDPRSLVQLCREAEMTPTNWYRIEAEEVKVLPLETLRRIEKVLNFSFSVFEDEIF